MLLTVTNLYPRPDQTLRGIFNAHLFHALNAAMTAHKPKPTRQGCAANSVITLVLVPEFKLWRWAKIKRWNAPATCTGSEMVRYVPVCHIPIIGRNMAWRFCLHGLKQHKELFALASDILTTWLYPDALAAGIMAREHGKPFWIKIHGTDRFHIEHPKRGRIIHDVVKDAAGFLPNAQFLADYLIEHGVPTDKVHVVRHGVDHERFHPRTRDEVCKKLKPQMNTDEHRFFDGQLVLYVGHLKPIKGPDRLLSAFAALRKSEIRDQKSEGTNSSEGLRSSTSDFRLLIIGDGPMRRKLERQAESLGISEQVHFLGSRSPEEVARWMNAAHCLCLPSRSEGMPNVVIEALASGCPVLATEVGDVTHLVRDGEHGFVVSNGESTEHELAEALNSALDRQWDAATISKTTANLSWAHAARQITDLMAAGRETGGRL